MTSGHASNCRGRMLELIDDALIAIQDRRPIPPDILDQLPPNRALHLADIATRAGGEVSGHTFQEILGKVGQSGGLAGPGWLTGAETAAAMDHTACCDFCCARIEHPATVPPAAAHHQPADHRNLRRHRVTEAPWLPTHEVLGDLPSGSIMISTAGIAHLHFDSRTGVWSQIRSDGTLEHLTATAAIALRPADIDQVLLLSMSWAILQGPDNARALALIDEVAAGAKTALTRYANLAAAKRIARMAGGTPR